MRPRPSNGRRFLEAFQNACWIFAVGERMTEDVLHDEKASADEVRRFCENEERAFTEFVMEQTSREIEERLPEIRLTWSDNDRWDFSHRRFIDVTGRNPGRRSGRAAEDAIRGA